MRFGNSPAFSSRQIWVSLYETLLRTAGFRMILRMSKLPHGVITGRDLQRAKRPVSQKSPATASNSAATQRCETHELFADCALARDIIAPLLGAKFHHMVL
jgi:hypothetical protein